jgi:hypothetical protein
MAFVIEGSMGSTGFTASGAAEILDAEMPGAEPTRRHRSRHPSGSAVEDLFIQAVPPTQLGELGPADLQIADAKVIFRATFALLVSCG